MSRDALLYILAILGAIKLASEGTRVLYFIFPKLLWLKARTLGAIYDRISITAISRRKISSQVEDVVNQTVFYLHQYLPKNWIKRARISWVRHSLPGLLRDGEIVLRIRPSHDSDDNIMQALWIYFRTSLFPENSDLIPGRVISGAALAIARAGLQVKHPYLIQRFDGIFLKNMAETDEETLNQFADASRINEYGLLMGPYLREVDYAASSSRFNADRLILATTTQEIMGHMLAFQPLLRINKPEPDWSYHGPRTSYGFMLVSKPPDLRPGIEAYVSRARAKVESGVE